MACFPALARNKIAKGRLSSAINSDFRQANLNTLGHREVIVLRFVDTNEEGATRKVPFLDHVTSRNLPKERVKAAARKIHMPREICSFF